jgi:predicted nucleic acid-binding protein
MSNILRVYLDCCCLQRPFDDQTQPRIKVESEAVLAILAAAQDGSIQLFSSDVLNYEISRIPDSTRRNEAFAVLKLAHEHLKVESSSVQLAKQLEAAGIKPLDALHLAVASIAQADFFSTTDDRLLKTAQSINFKSCKVVSVFELLQEVIP